MLIPDIIHKDASTGERLLFNKFKYDKAFDNLYILHSVFTYHHLRNLSGELDFLILYPNHGIFALEVKHGKIERINGKWIYTNKKGVSNTTTKSPFIQVDSSLHSIRKYILNTVKNDKQLYDRFKNILFGTGVAFTSMKEKVDFGQEAYPWQVLDSKELRSLSPIFYIDNLSKEWHEKFSKKIWYDSKKSKPSNKDCEIILSILRGNFNVDYDEVNRITDNNNLISQFTNEQYSVLDIILCNDRNLVQGLASVGKTSIAIEFIRRISHLDLKIALFCFNKMLGEKLKKVTSRINTSEESKIVCDYFHSYLSNNSDTTYTDSPDYFSEILPFDFILTNDDIEESEKFDIVVIDEAQDLLSPHYIEVIDLILKNGIRNGKWLFVGDFKHQSIYIKEGESALEYLSRLTSFTKYQLKINCRNPRPIVAQNELLTGISYSTTELKIVDPIKPEIKFPGKNKCVRLIEDSLLSILDKNIPISKIVLLSPKTFADTDASESERIQAMIKNGLLATTIHSFKGMESPYVILHGFSELLSVKSQELLYIGISRATYHLIIVIPNELQPQYNSLIQSNATK